MPYEGKRPIPASHPLAHDAVILGGQEDLTEEELPGGRHGVTVTVSWGYELHSVRIGAARWRRIRRGELVIARSRGWYKGKSFPCRWYFDLNEETSLVVNYGNDGGEGFVGKISHATIDERVPVKRKLPGSMD
jgi:hypothetical protein